MHRSQLNNKSTAVGEALCHIMKIPWYLDMWISDEIMFRQLVVNFLMLNDIGIDRACMNRTMSYKFGGETMGDFDEKSNTIGLFRYKATVHCPYDNRRRRMFYYCITKPGMAPSSGRPRTENFPALDKYKQFMSHVGTREVTKKRIMEIEMVNDDTDRCAISKVKVTQFTSRFIVNSISPPTSVQCTTLSVLKSSCSPSYWDSNEARTLFNISSDESVVSDIENRISLLQGVNKHYLSYKNMVRGYDKGNESSKYDIWVLQKATALSLAYTYALKYMKHRWSLIDFDNG